MRRVSLSGRKPGASIDGSELVVGTASTWRHPARRHRALKMFFFSSGRLKARCARRCAGSTPRRASSSKPLLIYTHFEMLSSRLGAVLAAAALAVGCGGVGVRRVDAGAKLATAELAAPKCEQPRCLWAVATGGKLSAKLGNSYGTTPSGSYTTVYVGMTGPRNDSGLANGSFLALHSKNGRRAWEFAFRDGVEVTSTPATFTAGFWSTTTHLYIVAADGHLCQCAPPTWCPACTATAFQPHQKKSPSHRPFDLMMDRSWPPRRRRFSGPEKRPPPVGFPYPQGRGRHRVVKQPSHGRKQLADGVRGVRRHAL